MFSKEFNQEKDFSNLNDWTISDSFPSSPNPPTTKCADISLVGGSKILGKVCLTKILFIECHCN